MIKIDVYTGDIPWQEVLSPTYFAATTCWTTCNGFCCRHDIPEFSFQFIKTGGSNLIVLEKEQDFIEQNGGSFEAYDPSIPIQSMTLDFGGTKPLTVRQATCRLQGLCDGKVIKPLHCRLYPFIPEFSPDGTLIDLNVASIFDATFPKTGRKSPCTVEPRKDEILRELTENGDLLRPLAHPYLMFHFSVYAIMLRSYAQRLQEAKALSGLDGAAFWKTWELLYLSGKLFDWDTIKRDIRSLEKSYEGLYGAFR